MAERKERRDWREGDLKGHNGRKKKRQREDKKKGGLIWFLVTQRAAEGLMGTNNPLVQRQQYQRMNCNEM